MWLLRVAACLALLGAWLAVPAVAERVAIGRATTLQRPSEGRRRLKAAALSSLGRVDAPAPQAPMRPLWTLSVQMRRLTRPTQGPGGTLYIGGDAGVVAVSADGQLLWRNKLGPVSTPPVVVAPGEVMAVAGGRLLRVTAGGSSEASLGLRVAGHLHWLSPETLLLGTPGGQLQVLRTDGTRLLGLSAPPARNYRFAPAGDEVVVLGPPRTLSWVSLARGLRRRVRLPNAAVADPVVGPHGTVWTVGEDARLLGHAPNGRLRAEVYLGVGRRPLPPAIGRDGVLRVGGPDALLGLDAGGAERFRLQLDGPPGQVVVARDDVALVVTHGGTLFVVEPDGSLRFRQSIRARGPVVPWLLPDGRVVIADQAGRLTAWR